MVFRASYDELLWYKQSVVVAQKLPPDANNDNSKQSDAQAADAQVQSNTGTQKSQPSVLTQFIADNVNHNIQTNNGSGTFHGMGIISATAYFANFAYTQLGKSEFRFWSCDTCYLSS